jgi:DNA-binding NtrC family response regulator
MEKTKWIVPPRLRENVEEFLLLYKSIKGTKKQPVLIRGPRGVGKTLFTDIFKKVYLEDNPAIAKDEANKVFRINIAAIPENLLESELFGHKKGSFTGAVIEKKGFFEVAKGGLLILEEVGDLSESVQAKLLTTMEDGIFYRVGDTQPRNAEGIQIIATSNQPDEKFRDDFRDRFIQFHVTPIFERRGDILYYLNEKFPDVLEVLLPHQLLSILTYQWPGNVREIERVGYLIRARDMQSKERLAHVDEDHIVWTDDLMHFRKADTLIDPFATKELFDRLKKAGVDAVGVDKELKKRKFGLIYDEGPGQPVFRNVEEYENKIIEDNYEYMKANSKDFRITKSEYHDRYTKIGRFRHYLADSDSDYWGAKSVNVLAFEDIYREFSFYCYIFYQNPQADNNLLEIEKNFFEGTVDYEWATFVESIIGKFTGLREKIKLHKQIYNYLHSLPKDKEKPQMIITDLTQIELLKKYCSDLLQKTDDNVAQAAKVAGLNDRTFRSQLKRLGLR